MYREMTTKTKTTGPYQGVANPRNAGQIRNVTKTVRKKNGISHDQLYNVIQLSYHLQDFLKELTIFPDLCCIVAVDDILNDLNKALIVKSDEPLLVSYDTTFDLGDFFVSVLVYKHVMFQRGNIIPVAFMIHDRRSGELHDRFFRTIKSLVPNLSKGTPVIVTDREPGIAKALKNYLSNCKHVFCWNHIKRDVVHWLKTHNAVQDDISVYMSNIQHLLHCETLEIFNDLYDSLSATWSEAFVIYFEDHLKTDFINNAIHWILEDLNIYDPYSGVTNNIVESMNSLIKRLIDWKEKPLDSIALSFYYLQNYYVNELLHGFCGLGNLTLKHRHRSAQMDRNHVVFPTNICHPDEIVELVKGELATAIQTDMNTDSTDEATTDATSEDIVTAESTSSIATVRQKRVYHVPEAGTFVVVGSKGDKYTVEMFPQEKCLCPSLGTCYHIIAVRMTLNLDNIDEKRVYNLTQLRKNSRKRPNKKAGKKQPRPCDEDQLSVINPAPDSAKKQYFFSSTPISTPQSILKKCKASPSIKPSAAKKIRFEHLPSLSDSEQHSIQTENFTTVNDFNFTALPSSFDTCNI